MKSKSVKNIRKEKKAKLAVHGGGPEGPSGKFWTLRVEPGEIISVADNIPICLVVIKNCGPGPVRFYAGYGDQQDLMPDKLRVTSAYAKITVVGKEQAAFLEMQFMPTSR